jgi:hypothetical protein
MNSCGRVILILMWGFLHNAPKRYSRGTDPALPLRSQFATLERSTHPERGVSARFVLLL